VIFYIYYEKITGSTVMLKLSQRIFAGHMLILVTS